jgi:hypothetical protein
MRPVTLPLSGNTVMDGFPEWIIPTLLLATAAATTLWITGAIYYDVCREASAGWLVASCWVGSVILLFVAWEPLWQPFVVLLGVAVLFLSWWFRQKPSQQRDWQPAVAVLPRAVLAGDSVTIENVRNFDYPSRDVFVPRYETRTFHLAHLKSADIIFFTWGSPWMSHPVLVFDFGPDGRVSVSIEVRYRKGQKYSILRSIYRQHELIFVVADQRDAILCRTKYRQNEQAHLYQFNASAAELRTVFLDYVDAINSLNDRPRWYHGLCANCTTTFYRLPNIRFRFDWRVLANGRLDRALYESGRLDRTLPFDELRRMAYLNEIANCAPEHGFGDHIRHELERRRNDR